MQKPKILYLGNALSSHGFTPTTIETLSKKLSADFEVRVASTQKNKILRLLDFWWHIVKLRKSVSYILIDTYSSSAFTFAWTSGAIARALGVKYIPFLHGGSLPDRFAQSVETSKKYLSGASHIVSPSGYLQHAVQQSFELNPVVIPNYLELENYPFLQRKNLDELKMLWVRSFHESYNPTMAINLLAWLKNNQINAQLTMVGPSKDESLEVCQQLAKKLDINSHVTFTGRLTKREWIALSAQHNLFINTTNIDNTPVSVMEAMALGMPVITTKVGGIPFLFEDGLEGLMTPVGEVEKMGEAILKLRKNPSETAAISLAARNKAESWAWEIVRKQWQKLLNS